MEPGASGREMSTDITHFAIKNKGIKAGPGGRSSVRLPASHHFNPVCIQADLRASAA
jgi:hypothetical protein